VFGMAMCLELAISFDQGGWVFIVKLLHTVLLWAALPDIMSWHQGLETVGCFDIGQRLSFPLSPQSQAWRRYIQRGDFLFSRWIELAMPRDGSAQVRKYWTGKFLQIPIYELQTSFSIFISLEPQKS